MHHFALSTYFLILASAALVVCTEDQLREPISFKTLLTEINELVDSLHRRQRQESVESDLQKLEKVSELLLSLQFRLMNSQIVEQTPRMLLDELVDQIRLASPQKISDDFEQTMQKLLTEVPEARQWDKSSTNQSDDCKDLDAPEVALDEFTTKCTKGNTHQNVLGCLGAATMYCNKIFPHKASEILGLITGRNGDAITVTCLEKSNLIFTSEFRHFSDHCPGCEQHGTDSVCQFHHGSEYAGVYVDRVSMKFLGLAVEEFMAGCFMAAKRIKVDYNTLHVDSGQDCRPGNTASYVCMTAASYYCNKHFGYSGGLVQRASGNQAEIACFNALYTGEVYISKDNSFLEAKRTLTKICSLDFETNLGKILDATPELLTSGVYNNKNSDVELRDIFVISKKVTTENTFRHSHQFKIGVEVTKKVGIPFIAGATIKVSASYTATVSLSETNSKTTEFSHTSEVFVPPRMAVKKSAIITRTNMDVPWRAVGISGVGRRVHLAGTWRGVDVSTFRVEQENI